MGISAPRNSGLVTPTTSLEPVMEGSMARGMLKILSRSGDQSPEARSMSMVREALVESEVRNML